VFSAAGRTRTVGKIPTRSLFRAGHSDSIFEVSEIVLEIK